MFNGIVEAVGVIKEMNKINDCIDFAIFSALDMGDIKIGDSIAVNGVCLTVTHFSEQTFHVTAVPETLRVTNLDNLSVHDVVNLEKSLLANSRLGGHYVQGHVDAVAEILDLQWDGSNALLAKISVPTHLAKYIVNKGYIAIDGMSITVIHAADNYFTVTFIPHTQQVTVVKNYKKNTQVNLEVDILSKYVEKLLGGHAHASVC